ncbi:unnamed protein product [Peronospora farinosa]|uniref:RWP-RK domain-containing protein n=1 Tax=Peronospora farinosa TaxID=134698 RepID=A0AAV0SR18_9STRA|nr:unnamed protein product [Peronospora farinosa]CAI5706216.1 unnamed protein product [Peronospora farinosa]
MSTFTAIRLPHLLNSESFRMHSRPYQCQGFGGIPHAVDYSTSATIPAQERMALPPLNILPSRVNASSGYSQKVAASPVSTFSLQPAQSPSKKRVRALPNASKSITLDMLRPHFEKPLAEAANIFGICMTLMKKICRKNGVPRWPHRQIRGLRKSIWSIEKALRCCKSEALRNSYNDHLQKQQVKLMTILKGPASPSSKAAFERVLSEPCSPMSGLSTPTVTEKARAVQSSPVDSYAAASALFQLPTAYSKTPKSFYQVQTSNKSPKLPSIASLLIKKDEPRPNFNYKF